MNPISTKVFKEDDIKGSERNYVNQLLRQFWARIGGMNTTVDLLDFNHHRIYTVKGKNYVLGQTLRAVNAFVVQLS